METGFSGRHGQIVVRNVTMVQERELEHVLILLLNIMDNPVMAHRQKKSDATNTHVRSMETGLSGHCGRIVVSRVIMEQEREVEHVLIHLLSSMDNPVKVHQLMKKYVLKNHVQ